jgi:hypothetical protein
MRKNVAVYRDIAIATSGICAGILHLLGGRWVAAALAIVAGAVWILIERRQPDHSPRYIQVLFLFLGLLMVWRFAESTLWLALVGVWGLVAATDLSRLVMRFPVDSPPLDQHLLVNRRLGQLGLVAASSAVLVGIARVLTLQLRLTAVALLSVFVVMVTVRIIRSIAGLRLPGNDE